MSVVSFNTNTPVPVPKSFTVEGELFTLDPIISAPTEFIHCAEVLGGYIKRIFGLDFKVIQGASDKGICLCRDTALQKEEYTVCADGGVVYVYASDTAGFSHGCSTILQTAQLTGEGLQILSHTIKDRPDISWRGLMVDLARANYSLDEILAYVDICYYYRLSVVHFHFADGVAYKIPSERFPNLGTYKTKYTKEEIDYLRKYISDRGLLILPEIEMPGHCEMFVLHPEVFGGSHAGTVCLEHEEVFDGLDTLISELCEMFPEAPYIHIGCDEVRHDSWENCEHCRAFMEKNGLKDTREMYGYMVDRCTRMVLAKGRKPIVWEGFSDVGSDCISKDVIVMVFQSTFHTLKSPISLTEAGFKVINTSWQPLYIVPSVKKHWNPDEVYRWKHNKWLYEPAVDDSEQMIVENKDMVMGAQICLWEGCHYKTDGSIVEENVAAMSERLWNENYAVDYPTFATAKQNVSEKLIRMIDESLKDSI